MRSARQLLFVLAAAVAACSSASETRDEGAEVSPVAEGADPSGSSDSPSAPGTEGQAGAEPTAAKARFEDICKLQASTCTSAPADFTDGSGLAAVDRCAFALQESDGLGTTPAVVTALEKLTTKGTVDGVLVDANRTATKTTAVPGSPPGIAYAFQWQSDDNASTAWIPQGITGSADADPSGKVAGKSSVLVSFYQDAAPGETGNGVRIAFVDTTNPASPKYRFALLVQPSGTEAAPSFTPVNIHAGGIVWFKDLLYVADTGHGFRVFDMRHIMGVATDAGAFGCAAGTCRAAGYKYVIPQVGRYEITSACSPLFSYVSLDTTSEPPALVSGEYCGPTACSSRLAGRVYRWPLDRTSGLLRSKTTFPTAAFLTSHAQVQGGASVDDTYYFSSSAPAAGGGELYRVAGMKSATSEWSNAPEDLMVDRPNGWLWSLSEGAGSRAVYAARLSAYPKP